MHDTDLWHMTEVTGYLGNDIAEKLILIALPTRFRHGNMIETCGAQLLSRLLCRDSRVQVMSCPLVPSHHYFPRPSQALTARCHRRRSRAEMVLARARAQEQACVTFLSHALVHCAHIYGSSKKPAYLMSIHLACLDLLSSSTW